MGTKPIRLDPNITDSRINMNNNNKTPAHDINEAASASAAEIVQSQTLHGLYNGPDSSFSLAFDDQDFLTSHETRGIRFQLEIAKPDIVFRQEGIKHTIVVFGSARFKSPDETNAILAAAKTEEEVRLAKLAVKNSIHYQKAYDFGRIVAERNLQLPTDQRLHILTGGGPGVMCAANRGAFEAGDKTIGMNIALPFEQEPNPYITPKLCFQFHYFASRKFSFLSAGSSTPGLPIEQSKGMGTESQVGGGGACAIVCGAGGYGSLDELFEVAVLTQVGKMRKRPIILLGREYWSNVLNLQFLADEGAISPEDIDLIQIADTAEEAWKIIKDFYSLKL